MAKAIEIGIDLATRKTGLCAIYGDGTGKRETVKADKFSLNNAMELTRKITWFVVENSNFDTQVFIELTNYGNKTTQMFSILVGMLLKEIGSSKVKVIDANEGQREFMKMHNIRKCIEGSKAKKGDKNYHKNKTYYLYNDKEYKNMKEIVQIVCYEQSLVYNQNIENGTDDEIDAGAITEVGAKCKGLYNGK